MPPAVAPRSTARHAKPINRRVTIRHACGTATRIAAGRRRRSPFQRVRALDISQGGIALVLRRAPAIGDIIFLQVINRVLGFTYDLAAEVRHFTRHKRGAWVVGLAFSAPLSHDELGTLI
jgi:c-di-GMP-binding flagellar brake protein YcgR